MKETSTPNEKERTSGVKLLFGSQIRHHIRVVEEAGGKEKVRLRALWRLGYYSGDVKFNKLRGVRFCRDSGLKINLRGGHNH
jgi:hypothetical protein